MTPKVMPVQQRPALIKKRIHPEPLFLELATSPKVNAIKVSGHTKHDPPRTMVKKRSKSSCARLLEARATERPRKAVSPPHIIEITPGLNESLLVV